MVATCRATYHPSRQARCWDLADGDACRCVATWSQQRPLPHPLPLRIQCALSQAMLDTPPALPEGSLPPPPPAPPRLPTSAHPVLPRVAAGGAPSGETADTSTVEHPLASRESWCAPLGRTWAPEPRGKQKGGLRLLRGRARRHQSHPTRVLRVRARGPQRSANFRRCSRQRNHQHAPSAEDQTRDRGRERLAIRLSRRAHCFLWRQWAADNPDVPWWEFIILSDGATHAADCLLRAAGHGHFKVSPVSIVDDCEEPHTFGQPSTYS